MSSDQITQLRISGLRTIQDLTLDLRGLTVLIGDNGTGKSSILEALELLRQAANPITYAVDIVAKEHGGLKSILRRGSSELRLGVTIEGAGPKLVYEFAVGNVGVIPTIVMERVDVYADGTAAEPLHGLVRDWNKTTVFDVEKRKQARGEEVPIAEQALALPWLGVKAQPAFQRITSALGRIELHVPFETRPIWQQRQLEMRVGPRWPALVEPAEGLSRYALNLPNAYQQLRNLGDEVCKRALERIRLGLGPDVRNFRLPPSGRGNIELELVLGSAPDKPLPVESLSEGQLSYLAFVALVELNANRSILAFDEPELHLHPALLSRVAWMLEEIPGPVVVATHSDRLLDALRDPLGSIVLCEQHGLEPTRLCRPNAERLAEWLEDYRGFGSIRADGYEAHVFEGSTTRQGEGNS